MTYIKAITNGLDIKLLARRSQDSEYSVKMLVKTVVCSGQLNGLQDKYGEDRVFDTLTC